MGIHSLTSGRELGDLYTCVNGGWAEGFPDNCLTDIGGYEEGDARAKSIALLQKLIQQEHHQPGTEQLSGGGG